MPEGTATGATSGGVIGGALGWLAGIGALAIPESGHFTIAAGPANGSIGRNRCRRGQWAEWSALWLGWGCRNTEAKRYEGRVRDGGVLPSVHCDDADWVKREGSGPEYGCAGYLVHR